jgi:hypothetical protein
VEAEGANRVSKSRTEAQRVAKLEKAATRYRTDPAFRAETKARSRAHYLANRDRILEHWKQLRRTADPEKRRVIGRQRRLRGRYGITEGDVARMLEEQRGLCAICAGPIPDPQVDHDHDTGVIRGVLCGGCNRGIGILKTVANLRRAIAYLERS